jgi:hypothetical protein
MRSSSQRNALLGWIAWWLVKRRLRRGGGLVRGLATLVAVAGLLAAVAGAAWWFLRRNGPVQDDTGTGA